MQRLLKVFLEFLYAIRFKRETHTTLRMSLRFVRSDFIVQKEIKQFIGITDHNDENSEQ